MPLPQQVIDRLSKEPPKTPGWSFGMILLSGGMFFIALALYAGLAYGYTPFVDGKIADMQTQLESLARSISSEEQGKLVTFYSEITNIKTVLANHVIFSGFFSWLEKNTQANVYYTRAALTGSNNQASL